MSPVAFYFVFYIKFKKVIIQPLYLYRFPCFRLNILITISDKPQNIPQKEKARLEFLKENDEHSFHKKIKLDL